MTLATVFVVYLSAKEAVNQNAIYVRRQANDEFQNILCREQGVTQEHETWRVACSVFLRILLLDCNPPLRVIVC